MFKRIKSITLEEKVDENPDLSYLGEINNEPKNRHELIRSEQHET